jgi:acetyl-CoA carboxylase biotin carboxyl carrier protein
MELKDIKKVVLMMKENDLTEFLLEDDTCTLQMKRGSAEVTHVMSAAPQMATAPAAFAAAPVAANVPAVDDGLVEITSPMVGTFYMAPSPDAEAFVEIGTDVTVDSVVCIVEAMKVMNEIKADVKGTIKKILVDNASPVQFGQPLFLVDPA